MILQISEHGVISPHHATDSKHPARIATFGGSDWASPGSQYEPVPPLAARGGATTKGKGKGKDKGKARDGYHADCFLSQDARCFFFICTECWNQLNYDCIQKRKLNYT